MRHRALQLRTLEGFESLISTEDKKRTGTPFEPSQIGILYHRGIAINHHPYTCLVSHLFIKKPRKVLTSSFEVILSQIARASENSKASPNMTHVTVDSVLPAEVYNRLLIDHDATEQSALLELKSQHVPALAKILAVHGVSDYVELHLLHRHFVLQEGEVMLHKPLVIPGSGADTSITVDIAKAVPCPNSAKPSLFPLMWMASSTGGLVAYEYGALQNGSEPRKIMDISQKSWDAFAQDFCAQVQAAGLQDIVSLKDKSCMSGGEYVVPSKRVLFRVPSSIINLQAGTTLIETGWTVKHSTIPGLDEPLPLPECTDGHVLKTRKTTTGSVENFHFTTKDGPDAFNPKEVDPMYTDRMWQAVELPGFFNVCPVAG